MFALILGVALLSGAGLGGYLVMSKAEPAASADAPPTSTPTTTPPPTTAAPPTATPTPTAPPSFAQNGPGTYVYAASGGPILGRAGTLRQFTVAVETGAPVAVNDFAAEIDATLGDARSWIASGTVRLQRVPPGAAAAAAFTIYLVTPGTAYKLCTAGGVDIRMGGKPYTSCRVGAKVVINLARYLLGIPNYGAPVDVYRQYAINHEVGHALGHGHELCPGKGMPAPVMQQQTLSLQGCRANAWPYVNGKRYAGPSGHL